MLGSYFWEGNFQACVFFTLITKIFIFTGFFFRKGFENFENFSLVILVKRFFALVLFPAKYARNVRGLSNDGAQ